MRLCEYGCGREAKYPPRKGVTKWCCEDSFFKCPGVRKKMSNKKNGYIPWNKGLKTGKQSKELIKKRMKNVKNKRSMINYYRSHHPVFFNADEVRENSKKEIEVKCKKCKIWFIPRASEIHERIRAINSSSYEENNLYCSDECKNSCETYRKRTDSSFKINNKNYTNEEYNTWRQEVLKRADNECEYCGEKATHCHHSRPQKLEPFFSLDPDYGIACCEKCHYGYGHRDECSTGELSSIVCK